MTTVTASELAPHRALLRTWLPVPLFALATAVGAQITVPIPGTPVPMTLQTLPVLLAPIALGPARGACAMLLYLLAGLLGLPVFAGLSGGSPVLLGPTAGYLFGFLLAQPLTAVAMRTPLSAWRILAFLVLANAAILIPGLAWLALSAHLPPDTALAKGLYPFLLGDLIKTAAALATALTIFRR